MKHQDEKLRIETEQNKMAAHLLWLTLPLSALFNYLGNSPITVVYALLVLGTGAAILFTLIGYKKIFVPLGKYIAFVALIVHAMLITYLHPSLNSIFLLFYNLVFMTLFLNEILIILTYVANIIMTVSYWQIYGSTMFTGYGSLKGLIIILFYMGLICIMLYQLSKMIKNLQKKTRDQFIEVQESNENIQNILSKVKEAIQFLKNFNQKVREDVGITVQVANDLNGTIGDIAASAQEQSSSVSTIHEVIGSNYQYTQMITDYSSRIYSYTEENTQTIEKGHNLLEQMVDKMNTLNKTINDTAKLMHEFNMENKNIEDILSTINNISKQTNLLSLNASIEAARAGEQGRGFAVVADEIRQLAESSEQSVETIGEILRGLLNKSSTIESKVKDGQMAVNDSKTYTDQTFEIFDKITSFNHEALSSIKEMHAKIVDLEKNSKSIVEQTEGITDASEVVANSVTDVLGHVENQNKRINNIYEQIKNLDNQITDLTKITETTNE